MSSWLGLGGVDCRVADFVWTNALASPYRFGWVSAILALIRLGSLSPLVKWVWSRDEWYADARGRAFNLVGVLRVRLVVS